MLDYKNESADIEQLTPWSELIKKYSGIIDDNLELLENCGNLIVQDWLYLSSRKNHRRDDIN